MADRTHAVRVLVADDQALDRAGLAALPPRDRGFTTREAGSLREALAQYRRDRPQAVLLGTQLPVPGGRFPVRVFLESEPAARILAIAPHARDRGLVLNPPSPPTAPARWRASRRVSSTHRGSSYSTFAAEDGSYRVEGLPAGDQVEVSVVLPLGFVPLEPLDGRPLVLMDRDRVQDFQLGCAASAGPPPLDGVLEAPDVGPPVSPAGGAGDDPPRPDDQALMRRSGPPAPPMPR